MKRKREANEDGKESSIQNFFKKEEPLKKKMKENDKDSLNKTETNLNFVSSLKKHSPETKITSFPWKPQQIQEEMDTDDKLWADKYRPTSTKDLVGNSGPISNLLNWLKKWTPKSFPKAALLSGNAGIGKTSTALLVTKECGYDTIEFNASDTRSKNAIQLYVSEMINNRSLNELLEQPSSDERKKICLIMDEVDGMSSGDRGGMTELISLIKKTKIPIICICNDHSSTKVRSLMNYCLDLRFKRPTVDQVKPRILEIIKREGFFVQNNTAIDHIIESAQGDMRNILNNLQMLRTSGNTLTHNSKIEEKSNFNKSIFDIVAKLISDHFLTLDQKNDLFMLDYELIPSFIQENYVSTIPHWLPGKMQAIGYEKANLERLELLSEISDIISTSDLANTLVHRNQHWELLTVLGDLSTIIPVSLLKGTFNQVTFPQLLGKQSSISKHKRLLSEIHSHTRGSIMANKEELRLQYFPLLQNRLLEPLTENGLDGIESTIEFMNSYKINREDWDSINELCQLTSEDPLKNIPSNVKSSFTRKYNSHHVAIVKAPKSKKNQLNDDLFENVEEVNDVEEEEEDEDKDKDDIKFDKLIKQGKTLNKKEESKKKGSKANSNNTKNSSSKNLSSKNVSKSKKK